MPTPLPIDDNVAEASILEATQITGLRQLNDASFTFFAYDQFSQSIANNGSNSDLESPRLPPVLDWYTNSATGSLYRTLYQQTTPVMSFGYANSIGRFAINPGATFPLEVDSEVGNAIEVDSGNIGYAKTPSRGTIGRQIATIDSSRKVIVQSSRAATGGAVVSNVASLKLVNQPFNTAWVTYSGSPIEDDSAVVAWNGTTYAFEVFKQCDWEVGYEVSIGLSSGTAVTQREVFLKLQVDAVDYQDSHRDREVYSSAVSIETIFGESASWRGQKTDTGTTLVLQPIWVFNTNSTGNDDVQVRRAVFWCKCKNVLED